MLNNYLLNEWINEFTILNFKFNNSLKITIKFHKNGAGVSGVNFCFGCLEIFHCSSETAKKQNKQTNKNLFAGTSCSALKIIFNHFETNFYSFLAHYFNLLSQRKHTPHSLGFAAVHFYSISG